MQYKSKFKDAHHKTKLAFSLGGLSLLLAIGALIIMPYADSLPNAGGYFDAGGWPVEEPKLVGNYNPLTFVNGQLSDTNWTSIDGAPLNFEGNYLKLTNVGEGLRSPIESEPESSSTKLLIKVKDVSLEEMQDVLLIKGYSVDNSLQCNIYQVTYNKDGFYVYSVVPRFTSYVSFELNVEKTLLIEEVRWIYTDAMRGE